MIQNSLKHKTGANENILPISSKYIFFSVSEHTASFSLVSKKIGCELGG